MTQENNPTIPLEALRDLLASRGMVVRAMQKISFAQGWAAINEIGAYMVPGFRIDEANRFAYENVLRWCINDPEMLCEGPDGKRTADPQKGLYIYGNVGTGKSMLLDVFRTFCRYYHINVKYGDQIAPLAWTTYRADDICDLFSQDGDLHRWKETKSLCVQDLGTEPTELLYMGNRRRVLRSILEARGDVYDRLTLISSNFPPNALADAYGSRVQSRIVQMCNPIYLGGSDRRK